MRNNYEERIYACCFCGEAVSACDLVEADYSGDVWAPEERKTVWCVACLPGEHVDKAALAAAACSALVDILREARYWADEAFSADERRAWEEVRDTARGVFLDMGKPELEGNA